jgi:TonB family protein
MSAYMQHDEAYFSRRSAAILLILALHVAIIWAFASGLGHTVLVNLAGSMAVVPIVDRAPPKEPPPLVPTTVATTTKVDIPNTDVHVEYTPDPDSTLVVTPAVPVNPGPPVAVVNPPVKRVSGGTAKGFPDTDDYYPAEALRREQEGTAIVRTCVDEKGRLMEAPTVSRTSGTASIDEGALRLAKAGSGHYRPTTEDGKPVSSCFELRMTFHVRKH